MNPECSPIFLSIQISVVGIRDLPTENVIDISSIKTTSLALFSGTFNVGLFHIERQIYYFIIGPTTW